MKNTRSNHLSRTIIIFFMTVMIAVVPNYSNAQRGAGLTKRAEYLTKKLNRKGGRKRSRSREGKSRHHNEQKRSSKRVSNSESQVRPKKGAVAKRKSNKPSYRSAQKLRDANRYKLEQTDTQRPYVGDPYFGTAKSQWVFKHWSLPLDSITDSDIDEERVYLLHEMDSILSDFEKMGMEKPYLLNIIEIFDSLGLESYIHQDMLLSPETQKAISDFVDGLVLLPENPQEMDKLLSLLYLFIQKNSAEFGSYPLIPDILRSLRDSPELFPQFFDIINQYSLYEVVNEMRNELYPEYGLEYP